MCGLFGFSGKENFNVNKIKILALYNETRGKDSTGYYTHAENIIKKADKATTFLLKNQIIEDRLLIGHCRSRTIGVVNKENAHPFNYGDIVMAHNGTLFNWIELREKYGFDILDFNVDSQLIAASLNKFNTPKVLEEFKGAAALLFTDISYKREFDRPLYAFRNSERPLYYGKAEEGIYFSSIEESLKMISCTNIVQVENNSLLKFKSGELIKEVKIKRLRILDTSNQVNNYNHINDSTSHYNQNVIHSFSKYDWLTYDSRTDRIGFKHGSNYQVLSISANLIEVINDFGTKIFIDKYNFSTYNPIKFATGNYAKLIGAPTLTYGNDIIAKEGNIVKILTFSRDTNELTFESVINGKNFISKLTYFLPLTEVENKKHINDLTKGYIENEDNENTEIKNIDLELLTSYTFGIIQEVDNLVSEVEDNDLSKKDIIGKLEILKDTLITYPEIYSEFITTNQ